MHALSMRAAFIAAFLALLGPAHAADGKPDPIEVRDAHARIVPGTKVGAVYMTIVNNGKEPDRLASVSTLIAGKAELHTVADENGVMKMRPVDGIAVMPGKSVEMKPRALHVMLMDIRGDFKPGDRFPMELNFDKAGARSILVSVEKPGGHGH